MLSIMKIPESKLEVMKVIWGAEIPISSKEIIKTLEEKEVRNDISTKRI